MDRLTTLGLALWPHSVQMFDTVAPLKKRLIKQRRLTPWYHSQICTLKQMSRKLERKWRSSNLEDFHIAWEKA